MYSWCYQPLSDLWVGVGVYGVEMAGFVFLNPLAVDLHAEAGGAYYEDAELFADVDRSGAPEAFSAVEVGDVVKPLEASQ